MDTAGGDTLGRFWAGALGLEFRADAGPGDVVGDVEGQGIAMCEVPETKSVKHRVHIDVNTGSISELEALGATVVLPAEESGFPWTVMADPEGGEFCAFLRDPDELPPYRFYELVVDAAEPQEIANWWADVFGVRAQHDSQEGPWHWIGDVPGLPFEDIVFVPVPEAKTVKNRIHWDVYADVEDMRSAGATLLRAPDEEPNDEPKGEPNREPNGEPVRWHVMADPEGNEFCVFDPARP